MSHLTRKYRLFPSTLLLVMIASPSWSSDGGNQPTATLTGIAVSFKLDPRLASGVYGGERWVSSSPYVATLNTVEARVQGIDAKGSSKRISAEWIPADPEVLSVSRGQGEQVTITVKRAGQTSLKIISQNFSKELAIKATSRGELMQVEISQAPDVRVAGNAGANDVPVLKSRDQAAAAEGSRPPESPVTGGKLNIPTLQTQQEKLSYALGANLGNGLRRESIEVDSDRVVQGLKDALSGSNPLLTQHEISIAIATLKTDLTSKRITSAAEKITTRKQLAEKNRTDGEAFQAENKAKDGVVTLDSGLQYKILKAGKGKKPAAGDTVVCKYRGTLTDGTEFDSSYKRKQPAIVGLNEVIRGWNEALSLMPVASKWQIVVPPNLGYGERGSVNSGIGPNATLIFEIELLSIKDASVQAGSKKTGAGVTAKGPDEHPAEQDR